MQQLYEYYQDKKDDRISKRTFVMFVVILVLFYTIIFTTNLWFQNNYRYITVNGLSMQPTLNSSPVFENGIAIQDGVYIKLFKNNDISELNYGDIIIINKVDSAGHTIIKRFLAKEGDKITIIKMNIEGRSEYRFVRIKSGSSLPEIVEEDYINGICYDENGNAYNVGYQTWSVTPSINKYEANFYTTFLKNANPDDIATATFQGYDGTIYDNIIFYKVGKNQIFYMGDNRTNSTDARFTGNEDVSKIVGKVVEITHNSTSIKNSFFCWAERTKGYLGVIWGEIVNKFAWNA